MHRKSSRVVAGLFTIAALGALLVVPADAATPTAAQGVSKDEIQIVAIVPDIDALRAKGITVSRLTTADFLERFKAYVDSYGPINGRKVVVKPVGWDPIDATSFDKACTAATQDNKPFLVVNGSGYRPSSIPCISVDNKTPFFFGDMANAELLKASGKNLVPLGVAPEAAAATAADVVSKTKLVPKTAKIGIVSNNEPGVKAAGDALEKALKKRGYDVTKKVELNGLAADAGLLNRESAAAATTFQAEGVDTVFNVQSFTQMAGFFQEMDRGNLKFNLFAIDGQANTCTPAGTGAARAPAASIGTTCITAWDSKAMPTKSGIKPDNEFEAKCRKQFDAATGRTSTPGGPSGDITVRGVTYVEDFPPPECTMASILLPAIKKAGKNLTWDKVYANIMSTTKAPMAYASNGEGGYGTKKPYLPTQMHLEVLNAANADTPKDANGTFNGCPVPQNCWIPKVVGEQEWFPIKTS